jgi:1-acyl-sn-glycerol-3-phosphate acyltransferase
VRGALIGVLAAVFAVVNTLLWATPFYVLIALRLLAPVPAARRSLDRALTGLASGWVASNSRAMDVLHPTRWRLVGMEGLSPEASYLVSSNHQSWTDILVLQRVLNRRVPFLRFFLKQELIWIPVLGIAWWALHFPFMKRYSPATLARHPELRGKDLETTRRVCARLRGTPVAILNFLEGTRFTAAKHAAQESPYRHLLRPKAGGLAFALAAMGDQMRSLLDVTIVYPGRRPSFRDFLCGRIPEVVVHVRERAIPREMLAGDYAGDERFRARFGEWVREMWLEKDALIERIADADASRADAAAPRPAVRAQGRC